MPKVTSSFRPPLWLRNCHLQTLLPRLLHRKTSLIGQWQQHPTADGDFVELFWHLADKQQQQPLVVLFHGLEGSVDSPYIQQLMQQCASDCWDSVVMHFRGCGPTPNRLARAYHSGDTDDARQVLRSLKARFPKRLLFAVGFSLGGNMLVKLLGEQPTPEVDAAIAVSAPIDLAACAGRIDQGFSKVYRNYLIGSLKRKFEYKQQQGLLDDTPMANIDLQALGNFWAFDDKITAPLHGFDGVNDYYQRASARPHLATITQPLLILHAKDDPFMANAVIPATDELAANTIYELSDYGGHMGFLTGSLGAVKAWLPKRLMQQFADFQQQLA